MAALYEKEVAVPEEAEHLLGRRTKRLYAEHLEGVVSDEEASRRLREFLSDYESATDKVLARLELEIRKAMAKKDSPRLAGARMLRQGALGRLGRVERAINQQAPAVGAAARDGTMHAIGNTREGVSTLDKGLTREARRVRYVGGRIY